MLFSNKLNDRNAQIENQMKQRKHQFDLIEFEFIACWKLDCYGLWTIESVKKYAWKRNHHRLFQLNPVKKRDLDDIFVWVGQIRFVPSLNSTV